MRENPEKEERTSRGPRVVEKVRMRTRNRSVYLVYWVVAAPLSPVGCSTLRFFTVKRTAVALSAHSAFLQARPRSSRLSQPAPRLQPFVSANGLSVRQVRGGGDNFFCARAAQFFWGVVSRGDKSFSTSSSNRVRPLRPHRDLGIQRKECRRLKRSFAKRVSRWIPDIMRR